MILHFRNQDSSKTIFWSSSKDIAFPWYTEMAEEQHPPASIRRVELHFSTLKGFGRDKQFMTTEGRSDCSVRSGYSML